MLATFIWKYTQCERNALVLSIMSSIAMIVIKHLNYTLTYLLTYLLYRLVRGVRAARLCSPAMPANRSKNDTVCI